MRPLHSPLHDEHAARGAKFAEFGGWSMPLEYAGGGVLAEHSAVREAAGLFDVSHLGKVVVRGPGAVDHVNSVLTNDVDRIGSGEAQYSMLCAEDGGVVDDLIVYRVSDFEVFCIPNASNSDAVARALGAEVPAGLEVLDKHRDYAVLAIQGPRSPQILADLGLAADADYMAFTDVSFDGMTVRVCRTGYTGERGYELVVACESAPGLWRRLLAAGEPHGLRPCGLGARDTLRTEMGYPLHGQDLGEDITPVMGRAVWAVGWDKGRFIGRDALTEAREHKRGPLLRGLKAERRGIPRPGMTVTSGEQPVGTVTSGTFSPTLRTGIALALLDRSVTDGDEVIVDIRGRGEAFTVVKPPFVPSNVR